MLKFYNNYYRSLTINLKEGENEYYKIVEIDENVDYIQVGFPSNGAGNETYTTIKDATVCDIWSSECYQPSL